MTSSLETLPPRVLISGASRGFGAALSQAFAERGARVFAGARDGQLAASLEGFAGLVSAVRLDVQSLVSIEQARHAVTEQVAALDIVVNNAAIRCATTSNELPELDFDDAKLTLDVNSLGPLRVTQAFLPLLRLGRSPTLVNVSSEAGSIGQCGRDREFDYCMSKAALNMATKLLVNYLKGVRVFALHPGWLRTDMGGAHAALDPLAAARESAALIEREAKNPSGPLFVDHTGAVLPW